MLLSPEKSILKYQVWPCMVVKYSTTFDCLYLPPGAIYLLRTIWSCAIIRKGKDDDARWWCCHLNPTTDSMGIHHVRPVGKRRLLPNMFKVVVF